jgi:hypothetical protein
VVNAAGCDFTNDDRPVICKRHSYNYCPIEFRQIGFFGNLPPVVVHFLCVAKNAGRFLYEVQFHNYWLVIIAKWAPGRDWRRKMSLKIRIISGHDKSSAEPSLAKLYDD